MPEKPHVPHEECASNDLQAIDVPSTPKGDFLFRLFCEQEYLQAVLVKQGKAPFVPYEPWNQCADQRECEHSNDNLALCTAHTDQAVSQVREHALAMLMEAAELLDWTPWKPWSERAGNKTELEVGSPAWWHEVRIELADILHFLLNACMAAGMNHRDVLRYYLAKHQTNQQRHGREGY